MCAIEKEIWQEQIDKKTRFLGMFDVLQKSFWCFTKIMFPIDLLLLYAHQTVQRQGMHWLIIAKLQFYVNNHDVYADDALYIM